MARDAFGATWGYLVGAPKFQVCTDKETKRSVLLKPEAVLKTLDRGQHGENNYAELMVTYLRPPRRVIISFGFPPTTKANCGWALPAARRPSNKLCSNPAWAGFRDYQRFPSQKSASLRLQKGEVYPLQVLHGNGHMGGSLSVSWTKPGADKPEPIPADCLAVSKDGQTAGVRERMWGGVAEWLNSSNGQTTPRECDAKPAAALYLTA